MDSKIKQFNAGIHNLLPADVIPNNASQDSLNWITQDGRNILSYGRNLLGAEGLTGRIDGLHYGYKTNGEKVLFRKAGTKIQYWTGTTWTDVITGLTADSDYSFANYSSLAGAFVIISGIDGLYKINTANPTTYLSLYVKGTNDKGKILIDKGRMFMWDCSDVTKTSLRLSWIDAQDSTNYTTITGELLEGSGTTYVGTLDFKALVAIANCFALVITGNTSGGTETFVDNRDGTLTGSLGGTGTINYITGAYSITFNSAVTIAVDQQQTTQNSTIAFGEANATTKYFTIAQMFRPSKTALGGVRLYKTANTGTPAGDIYVDVVTNSGGSPTSTVLTSVQIPIATYMALPLGEFDVLFDSAITVGVTTDYWFRVYSASDTSNHPNLGINTAGGYASGGVKYFNSADGWQAIATIDLYFKTIYGNASVDYQYENSNSKGITDFTFAVPRVEGTGNLITQDIGGDKIINVLIGQDGKYYSLKENSAYYLSIADDDKTFTNLVYRREMGIPFFRASISSLKGIIFMNTANEEKPILTILQRNALGNDVEPVELLSHFKFADYDYSDCCIDTFDRYILIACKLKGNATNDRILLCNLSDKTVDVLNFKARMFAKDGGNIYLGHPLTMSTYQIFNGFDDDGIVLDNYWTSNDENYNTDLLKKFRRLRFQGLIDPDQSIEVYMNYDNAGFELVGTIVGSGSYVDYSSPQTIGSNLIGGSQIGGDEFSEAYPYLCEIKIKTPKFNKRTIKLVAKGIGYADVQMITDWDILTFEQRIPSKHRNKSNVSLDGTLTNQ